MAKLVSILILILFSGPSSWALGIWFEPYAGYETGDREEDTTSYDAGGQNLGLRLGTMNNRVFFGLEYALATIDVDRVGEDEELETKDLGIFVGYAAQPLRFWFTYWLQSEADDDGSTLEGKAGYKFGLGINIMKSISLNVEKTLRTYNERDNTDLNNDIEIDGMLVSVSVPVTF